MPYEKLWVGDDDIKLEIQYYITLSNKFTEKKSLNVRPWAWETHALTIQPNHQGQKKKFLILIMKCV